MFNYYPDKEWSGLDDSSAQYQDFDFAGLYFLPQCLVMKETYYLGPHSIIFHFPTFSKVERKERLDDRQKLAEKVVTSIRFDMDPFQMRNTKDY